MNPHRGSDVGAFLYDEFGQEILPDPPENPEFNELFTEAEQIEITRRFHAGITKNDRAVYEARQRAIRSERIAQDRKERRAAAREARLARVFNPVLRSRP